MLFKTKDRIRIIKEYHGDTDMKEYVGKTGTIMVIDQGDCDPIGIKFDKIISGAHTLGERVPLGYGWFFQEDELEFEDPTVRKKREKERKNTLQEHKKTLPSVLKRIKKHARVQNAWISKKDNLIVITKPITFQDINLGSFVIYTSLHVLGNAHKQYAQSMDWINCYPHPLIDREGFIHKCGINDFISSLWEKDDYYGVIDSVITFLEDVEYDHMDSFLLQYRVERKKRKKNPDIYEL